MKDKNADGSTLTDLSGPVETMTIVEALEYYLKDIPENYIELDMVLVRIPFLRGLLKRFREQEATQYPEQK